MTEATEWERWGALVAPILEASPSLSEPELGGLTEQIVDAIMQQTRADRESARVALDVALGSKSWSLGLLGQEEVAALRQLATLLGVDPEETDPLRSDDGWKILQRRAEEAEAELAELKDWRRSAWALLTAVASSGVEHEDSRMDYLTVQIDRGVWDALEPYRLRPNQFEGDDEDAAEAMASVRRGEFPEDSEGRDAYKAARGVAPAPPGSPSPEEAIRRIRGDDSAGWEQEAQAQDERAQWAEEARDEARAEVERLKAENLALTASLRAANATTRAAQERADRAETALRGIMEREGEL